MIECLSIPFILCARAIVHFFPCICKHKTYYKSSLDGQLNTCRSRRGGYWSGSGRKKICTRENFYVFLGETGKTHTTDMKKFVHRLAENMNRKGQVPYSWEPHWWSGEEPQYRSKIKEVSVIDSNMFFLILIWELHEKEIGITELYLPAQRAFKWLEKHIAENTIYEPIDSSWETTIEHNGHLLLSNVIMARALRAMELIAMVHRDERIKNKCSKMYDKFIAKWQPELFRTQECLPRILGVYWNLVPSTFLASFNQEIQTKDYTWIPLRVKGPVETKKTYNSWIKGTSDLHTEIIWPFIGFLWVKICAKRLKKDIAFHWWESYMDFHAPRTLHNVYEPKTGKPVRRAFLKAEGTHAATISMFFAARNGIDYLHAENIKLDLPV